jgi:hypothetical protein
MIKANVNDPQKCLNAPRNDSFILEYFALLNTEVEESKKQFHTIIDTCVRANVNDWISLIKKHCDSQSFEVDSLKTSVTEALRESIRGLGGKIAFPPHKHVLKKFFDRRVHEVYQCDPAVVQKFEKCKQAFDSFQKLILDRVEPLGTFNLSVVLRDFFIHLESAKRGLDFYKDAHQLLEKVRVRDVTVISTPTGSGKSTLMPLILLSGGINISRIAITQPRRLAASCIQNTLSKIYEESLFGFAMANKRKNPLAPIVYVTDGYLRTQLKLKNRPPSRYDYDCIIIDEAHERSEAIEACIALLGQMKRMQLRVPKIILSSATIHEEHETFLTRSNFTIARLQTTVTSPFTRTRHFPDRPCRHECKICQMLSQITLPITIISWILASSGIVSKNEQVLIFMPTVVEVNKCVAELRERNIVALPLFANQLGALQDQYIEEGTILVSTKYICLLFVLCT